MPSFRNRSYRKELLDGDNIPFPDIKRNMEELDLINHRLGGHRITKEGLSEVLRGRSNAAPVHIVEIGCGGGDNLRVIRQWAEKKKIAVALTGIDVNEQCIVFARSHEDNRDIRFIHSDYRDVAFPIIPDIIFSSLFCHHFDDDELVFMLRWMKANSCQGFFINDLHRHPLAFYAIRLLTKFFSRSYLVKNDAPLSVQRGFRRKDWVQAFKLAHIDQYNCRWRWAFRWLVTCHTHDTANAI
jgi:SAM-dependent methyltransferase